MSMIKKFFQKKKLDVKFKKAGEGHKLTEESSRPTTSGQHVQNTGYQPQRSGPSDEARMAAEAALARTSQTKPGNTIIAQKARMKKEMEAEKQALDSAMAQAAHYSSGPKEVNKESAPVLSHILYTCPDIGPAVLPKQEMDAYIEEFLLKQLAEEPEMASALMIQTLNKDKEKVKVCVDTLTKILDNIIAKPEEEKFRKIRLSTKTFTEKIKPVKGSEEFLQSAGFHITTMEVDNKEEHFFLLEEHIAQETERLSSLKDVLLAAEPIKGQLDRAVQVYHPSNAASRFDIPEEFYNISREEMQKEQQRRQEAVDKLGMLRTKAMRERDELRELRKYKFTLLRIRFPNGILLQGTFRSTEKLSAVSEFIQQHLVHNWVPFQLSSAGQTFSDMDLTLAEAGLAPAACVNFAWDREVMASLVAAQGPEAECLLLQPELMARIQTL